MSKELTLKDIIDVLCHYDLEHSKFPSNYVAEISEDIPIIYGMACDDKRKIFIDEEAAYETMREVVLHEIYHCHHFLKGDLDGVPHSKMEKIVTREAKDHVKKLYSRD